MGFQYTISVHQHHYLVLGLKEMNVFEVVEKMKKGDRVIEVLMQHTQQRDAVNTAIFLPLIVALIAPANNAGKKVQRSSTNAEKNINVIKNKIKSMLLFSSKNI